MVCPVIRLCQKPGADLSFRISVEQSAILVFIYMEPLNIFFDQFKPAHDNTVADYILSTDEIIDIIKEVSGQKLEKELVYKELLDKGFKYVPIDKINGFQFKFLIQLVK
jgi:hypothetical protein